MVTLFDHPYGAFLEAAAKPNRYTGAEHGVRRKDWNGAKARVCLAFPDVYDIGMSHLGYRILYAVLNDDDRILAERCYTPWVDLQAELVKRGLPLVSLESARPLRDFDVVGFSLQYELTYTNLLTMLTLAGLSLRTDHRSDDEPLVIAGGPAATHMEPLADFLDAVLIGDGEEALPELALAWTAARRAGTPRPERLRQLARLPGVYVPSLYETAVDPASGLRVVTGPKHAELPFPIKRRVVTDLSRYPFPATGPVGGPETVFDRMSIEVARGCTEGCRFCQAGIIYRPVRERDPQEVIDTVLRALTLSGQDEVSLTALSTADVSYICPLTKQLAERTACERVSLSVASLRAYGLPEELLDELRKVRASGLTFAPEAGTQRLRDVINKNVTEEQLLETAARVFSRGFDKLKLYFIIGLPTEQDEDVLSIVRVGRSALAVGKRLGKRPRITLSVSTHVPKPHTPFQWCAMDEPNEIARKQQLLRDAARGIKGLGLRLHDAETCVLEGILARGDRRLGPAIERAFARGARFDSWEEHLRMDLWTEAFAHHGIDTRQLLSSIPRDAPTPWDHLDVGIDRDFLTREYQKALRGQPSPPCSKAIGQLTHHTNVADATTDQRQLVCYDCGAACDLDELRSQRVGHLQKLGALTPTPTSRPTPGSHPELVRPPQPGGRPVRWRLRFGKTGPFALLGHLDLIRELPRVFRRARVRVAYTAGFHPKPDMSFCPALPLGIASLGEYVDLRLIDAPPAHDLVTRLNQAAGGGLRFHDAAPLSPDDPPLSSVIDGARYVIALATEALAPLGGCPGIEARVEEFMAAECVQVERDAKRGKRLIDVRHFVTQLRVGDEDSSRVLTEAGLVGEVLPLETHVKILTSGAVRPREIVAALTGDAAFPHRTVRAGLLAGATTPVDLERLRGAQ